jgi:hypothetical protein
VLKTDGQIATWAGLTSADIADANAERLASIGRAIAFAVTL